jgi:hypothetical protein
VDREIGALELESLGEVNMRRASLAVIGILFIGMVLVRGTGAFEIGENIIGDSSFEAGVVGSTPLAWWLKIVG